MHETHLIEECAKSSSAPIARKTYDGSREADVQALPLDRATSLRAIKRDSPRVHTYFSILKYLNFQ